VIYHDGYKLFQFHDSGKTELYAITKDLAETKNLGPKTTPRPKYDRGKGHRSFGDREKLGIDRRR
jgi:hypothetical protein